MAPFKIKSLNVMKDAAIVDREVRVYNINGTQHQDIVAAVKVASFYYRVPASVILSDIYAKNLNVESENAMGDQALIRANRQLYSSVCESIIKAARELGVTNELNFYVFSKSNNPRIPQNELHAAMKEGGANSVSTDEKRYKVYAGSNDDQDFIQQMTNFHLATLRV